MKRVNYREVNCLLCVNWMYKIKLVNHKLEWIWKVVIVKLKCAQNCHDIEVRLYTLSSLYPLRATSRKNDRAIYRTQKNFHLAQYKFKVKSVSAVHTCTRSQALGHMYPALTASVCTVLGREALFESTGEL